MPASWRLLLTKNLIFNQDGILQLLDTLDENTIAQKLYLSMGFSFIDTVEIKYKDIGEPRTLYCYELVL